MVLRTADALLITIPDDGARESQQDCWNCVHCGRSHVITDNSPTGLIKLSRTMGFCMRCNGPTCGELCQECVPMEAQLDNLEDPLHAHEYRAHRKIVIGGFQGYGG